MIIRLFKTAVSVVKVSWQKKVSESLANSLTDDINIVQTILRL